MKVCIDNHDFQQDFQIVSWDSDRVRDSVTWVPSTLFEIKRENKNKTMLVNVRRKTQKHFSLRCKARNKNSLG
jgi:hypothetical protein